MKLNATQYLEKLEKDGNVSARVTRYSLNRIISELDGIHVEFEPTNASTEEIIENIAIGAMIGAGLGTFSWLITKTPNPLAILGGALIGAGTFAFLTKYRVTIRRIPNSENYFHLKMEAL
jgi:hypothetical protein